MKKLHFLPVAFAGVAGLLAFSNSTDYSMELSAYKNSHIADNSGAVAGKTGAPGENNCTQCHTGTAQSGAGVNTVVMTEGANVVTDYTPGTTYNVAVSIANASAVNGFQIVALNSSNAQAGTITIIPSSGTQLKNGAAGKKYVTHTLAGNTQSTWAFQWTAPATNVGNVTFYLATNRSNAMDNSAGDAIFLSQHVYGSVAGTAENQNKIDLSLGYQPANNVLTINYSTLSAGESTLNLVDLNGKSVFNESIGNTEVGDNTKEVRLPDDLKAGVYIANLNVNNNFVSKKIYIQK
ncbi:MAG TPA: choice-of-anchor V domain-containing protein [Fluviicola sp.]|nr:choice-of-anchor V domain-containing protein [Fluviicola sp.]